MFHCEVAGKRVDVLDWPLSTGADCDDATMAVLRALIGPRLYVSVASRWTIAKDRAFATGWRMEGPECARAVLRADWPSSVATDMQALGPPRAEARWISDTSAVLMIVARRPSTRHAVDLSDVSSPTPWEAIDCATGNVVDLSSGTRRG